MTAKSPNENLNYALPIANVLDSPPSKARFDERTLTKLPYTEGSQTYSLKDEFALPLSWEKFSRAYQALIARHNAEARAMLLSTYGASIFPRGSGSESILYSSDSANRKPGIVMQQPDGDWVIQVPELQYTDLPGDGKVGVAPVPSGGVIALHRSSEASDDAFYSDSKAFMDIALKALNVRRTVGTDQVRAVSLGAATSDVVATDTAGRKWQVRVWPLPYEDGYLLAQLLPTPDGYAGLFTYVPSAGLGEAKAQLALVASQFTLTYLGTTKQWQAYLARGALLPESLKDVKLQSSPQWKLSTPRFEMSVPPDVLQVDTHSELLLGMNYSYDGPRVVWGVGGAWWHHDAQEKDMLGLWRAPRPPPTVKLEQRARFDDLQARRSPYDGTPVRATSDAIDAQVGIQAPGTKEGTASSGVAYGLSLRLGGLPTPIQMEEALATATKAIHILERGVGPDVAESAPASATAPKFSAEYVKALQQSRARTDRSGGGTSGGYSNDGLQLLGVTPRQSAPAGMRAADSTEAMQASAEYAAVVPALNNNRDLWALFLIHNHLPIFTPHDNEILAAEESLRRLVLVGGPPQPVWTTRSSELNRLYIFERSKMAIKVAFTSGAVVAYKARRSACPAAADHNSGSASPKMVNAPYALEEYYPPELLRQGIEGTVVLSLKVNAAGCVTDIGVAGSSGSDALDDAAMSWVETAAFLPGEKDGNAADTSSPLIVRFELH